MTLTNIISFSYYFPDDLPDDRNCEYCVHCCINYDSWLSFQNVLYKIVKDPLFELFITLCIVLNTTFLALEHHGMSETVRSVLDIGNKVMTTSFLFPCDKRLTMMFSLLNLLHPLKKRSSHWYSLSSASLNCWLFQKNFFNAAGTYSTCVS